MKVLLIDDDDNSIDPVRIAIEEGISAGIEVQVETDFKQAQSAIGTFQPDIVVIDLLRTNFDGSSTPDGLGSLESVWESRFCPVIVYSAEPQRVSQRLPNVASHPLVRLIQKGQGSEAVVVECLRDLRDHVEVLNGIMESMQSVARVALREVAPVVWDNQAMAEDLLFTVERASKRRLAASFDLALDTNSELHPWEQYVFPPLGRDPMLGDLLRTRGTCWDIPSAYRVVLSPSCDLASSGHRPPSVQRVTVARCKSWQDGLSSLNLKDAKVQTIRKRLPSILNRGFQEATIPLPGLERIIPTMLVDLRDLELAPIENIGNGTDCEYQRVASLDSPFRELVSWAYLQTAGRPGLPVRNVESWASDVANQIQASR